MSFRPYALALKARMDYPIRMSEIVVATRNKKKIEEIGRMLQGADITLLSLDDFDGVPDVEETGATFRENAILKSRAIAAHTGKPALADDSGLEVYALGGGPGVRSARYAGETATDKDNVKKLLRELADFGEESRGARFACVIALTYPDGREETFTGHVEGRIGRRPSGRNGFGYDPVFYPKGHDKTFAEMSGAEKDGLSHRGEALEKLRNYFLNP